MDAPHQYVNLYKDVDDFNRRTYLGILVGD